MEEIIQKIQEKAGISAEQAALALEAMVEHVKTKVPPFLHDQIDSMLRKDQKNSFMNKAQEWAQQAKKDAEGFGEKAKQKSDEWSKEVKDDVDSFMNNMKNRFSDKH